MPYNSWVQFCRQRRSIGLPKGARRAYPARPLIHSKWGNYRTFSPALIPTDFPTWVQNNAGVVTILVDLVPPEMLEGVRNYGALLESLIPTQPPVIRASAGGAVIYDRARDRLYYAASRWRPRLVIHEVLAARVEQLPVVQTPTGPMHTLWPNRHAQTCAEFQALNEALIDGAQERNLELWCFRATTIEPLPRCPNCRITVPDKILSRIWTC